LETGKELKEENKNLDAIRRNDVAESVMVIAEELREVVKKNKKDSE
jgi:hypothetical protein